MQGTELCILHKQQGSLFTIFFAIPFLQLKIRGAAVFQILKQVLKELPGHQIFRLEDT